MKFWVVGAAQFLDGAFEGLGAETFADGMYVGSFHAGLRHGLGELQLSTSPRCCYPFQYPQLAKEEAVLSFS